jgi:hypothetical protein
MILLYLSNLYISKPPQERAIADNELSLVRLMLLNTMLDPRLISIEARTWQAAFGDTAGFRLLENRSDADKEED